MGDLEFVKEQFSRLFSSQPEHMARAPGRVNLIGEHTDYNGGFVLPMAIDQQALIAARMRTDRLVRAAALDLKAQLAEFSLDAIQPDAVQRWSNYVRGVALLLQQHGVSLPGLELAIHSTVPSGSGLSSSAALEVCAAILLQEFSPAALDRVQIAQLCQKVENNFVGVQSGIMDQFVSALAQVGHALLLDCRDLSYRYVPMPRGATVIVCDTKKRRGLVTSEYNTRRAECEQAARTLGVQLLREVSVDDFARRSKNLPPVVAQRARHVITENTRVLQAVDAMEKNDLERLGRLMDESHASLRDDYAVSSPELDAMVQVARAQPGCLGARLTGAGFGGCTVNLVRDEHVPTFVENVAQGYAARTGITPPVYVCHAAAGAEVLF